MSHGDWKDMFYGVQNNDLDLVQYHIRMGVDVNYQHPEFMTSPLIESIRCGHLEMFQLLINNGASLEMVEIYSNKSPLSVAKESANQEIINLILSIGPAPDDDIMNASIAQKKNFATFLSWVKRKFFIFRK